MAFDIVWLLKKKRCQAVMYKGKPYMLLGAHYKKVGVENVFGTETPVVEAQAELLVMGTSSLKYVPAEEVEFTKLKWDYELGRWYDPTEQLSVV